MDTTTVGKRHQRIERVVFGFDQFGKRYVLNAEHPRKDLLEQLGGKRAEKIYVGAGVHVGYVVRGYWVTFYDVTPWEGKAL